MPDHPTVPADPRAAFDAMRALEDAVLAPVPDPQAMLDAARALEEALVGKRES